MWQGIPAADRKIMEDTMMEVGRKTLDWDKETAAKYRKDLEAKGMTFVEAKDGLDVEAFRKRGAWPGRTRTSRSGRG